MRLLPSIDSGISNPANSSIVGAKINVPGQGIGTVAFAAVTIPRVIHQQRDPRRFFVRKHLGPVPVRSAEKTVVGRENYNRIFTDTCFLEGFPYHPHGDIYTVNLLVVDLHYFVIPIAVSPFLKANVLASLACFAARSAQRTPARKLPGFVNVWPVYTPSNFGSGVVGRCAALKLIDKQKGSSDWEASFIKSRLKAPYESVECGYSSAYFAMDLFLAVLVVSLALAAAPTVKFSFRQSPSPLFAIADIEPEFSGERGLISGFPQ